MVNRVKSVAYSTETVKIFRSYDNLVRKVMPTIYLCNIIQFYFMTSAKTYQSVLPHVFHAISRDVIRIFHTLFHTCCGNSHAFSHMLRKFAHCSACIHTVWNTFRIPTYGVLFRMNSTLYGIWKSLGILLLSHNNDRLER